MKPQPVLLAVLLATATAPAHADIVSSSDAGFAVATSATVPADPSRAWAMLIQPRRWWSKDHTFGGSAANLSLDPKVGGCFCETLPGKPAGGVRHMTVINVRPHEMLRMSGALGPMQGEAISGTLTIDMKPAADGGTTIAFSYVAGGYSRIPLKQIAPAVDRVLSEQLQRLAKAL